MGCFVVSSASVCRVRLFVGCLVHSGPALANRRPCSNFLPPPFLLLLFSLSVPLPPLLFAPRTPLNQLRVWHRWRHTKIFSPRLPFHHPYLFFPFPLSPISLFLRLEVDPQIDLQLGVSRSAVSSSSGVWDGALAESESGEF